jgi:hypothetical protein
MNAYGRYVHIFFGVLFLLPLLLLPPNPDILIAGVMVAVIIFCAITGVALIARAVVAPALPVPRSKPGEPVSS